jgi:hypothetical protein
MLKNVTITLPEETLRAVRIAAAHDGVSMSKWLGRLVETSVGTSHAEHQRPLAFQKASVQLTDENGNAPTKEWMNDRESLRRFERPDLREGFAQQSEVRPLQSVAEPPEKP